MSYPQAVVKDGRIKHLQLTTSIDKWTVIIYFSLSNAFKGQSPLLKLNSVAGTDCKKSKVVTGAKALFERFKIARF